MASRGLKGVVARWRSRVAVCGSQIARVACRGSQVAHSRVAVARVARRALQVAGAGRVGTDIDILSVVRATRAAMARPARSLGCPDREGGVEPAWPNF